MEGYEELKESARRVFGSNRAEVKGKRFTYPSRRTYQGLFGWDSAFHAVVLAHLDPMAAKDEILTLLSFQDEDGRLTHEVSLGAPNLSRRAALFLLRKVFDSQKKSHFIDPPMVVEAAWRVFELEPDRSFLAQVYSPLIRLMTWIQTNRAVEHPVLVSILHPFESGADASPQFDEAVGTDFSRPLAALSHGRRYLRLIGFYARQGWDLKALGTRAPFLFQDPCFNAITARGWLTLSRMAIALHRWDDSKIFQDMALTFILQMNDGLWDPEAGLYRGRYLSPGGWVPARRLTLSGAVPIFSGIMPRDYVKRIVDNHLAAEDGFWTPLPFSYNPSRMIPAREKTGAALWRGPCAWMNMNWMIGAGLLEYGYLNLVKEMAERCAKVILDQGFREYYHSRSGLGMGAVDYTWPGLIIDLMYRIQILEDNLKCE